MHNNDLLNTAASTIDRDVIVVANAGSGKTHLLVEHYFFLLAQGFSPHELVAFTFTEKAALQLKERILQNLPHHKLFKSLPEDTLDDWKQNIMESSIGTIHQFCLRIIQDDPGPLRGLSWEILEEGAEAQLREEVLRNYLETAFAKDHGPAKNLLQHYGISVLLRILRNLLTEEDATNEVPAVDFPDCIPQEGELLKDLLSITQTLHETLKNKKLQSGRLSFFDLEKLALERLEDSPATGKGFWRLIRHILVDEFQDTSPIQIRIIAALRRSSLKKRPKLFCVGDPKQSIYRFRHVDQTLLQKTAEEILAEGGVKFDFITNYRSRPALIDFVNNFSSQAFPNALPSTPLPQLDEKGAVHWISLPPLEKKATSEQFRQQEANWVTQQIIKLGNVGTPLEQIAILYRASASSRPIVKALEFRGIPFTLRGGRSLWERQEILDLQNLLFFLEQPKNSMALLGILRSPLFLISDITFFWLTYHYKGDQPLWSFLVQMESLPKEISSEEKEKFQWAIKYIQFLQKRFASIRPGALLREITEAWDLRSLYGKIEGDLESILAIEQFLDYLDKIEGDETMSRLRQIKRTSIPFSPLGDVLESKSCVQLLTIHAAKGLEFSKVFLLDLDRPPPHPPKDLQRLGSLTGLKIKHGNEWEETPLYKYIKDRHQTEEAEENKRLLYVALTRAKEDLFIPMTEKSARKDTLKHLLCSHISAFSPKTAPMGTPIESDNSEISLPKITPIFEKSLPINNPPSAWATVSELEIFSQCALRHHYSYQENISDQDWSPPGSAPDPADLGTLLHRVLHEWSFYPDKDLGEILPPLLAANPLWNREVLLAELYEQLVSYRESNCYDLIKGTDENFSELPFLLKFSNGWVRGQIDRLLKIDKKWHLIDFKSTQRRASEGELLEDYGFQLKTYALAASQFLHGEIPRVQIHVVSPPRSFHFSFSQEDLKKHEARLDLLLEKMKAPDLKSVGFKDHCHRCPYWKKLQLCPIPGRQDH